MHTPHTNTPLHQNNILSPGSEGMSRLRRIMFLFIIASLFLAFTTHNAIPSVSFTASNQLKYWFENVKDHMLEAIYPNYLPLIKMILIFHFTLSNKYLGSNTKFCSLANLACYWDFNSISPLILQYIDHKSSLVVQKVDHSSFYRMSVLCPRNRIHLLDLEHQFPWCAFLPSQIMSKGSLEENDFQKIFFAIFC